VKSCQLYSNLWARLKQQGLPDQLASLQNVGKKGRGLVAETKIKMGEELLQVSFHSRFNGLACPLHNHVVDCAHTRGEVQQARDKPMHFWPAAEM
jgi:hypothetical protein